MSDVLDEIDALHDTIAALRRGKHLRKQRIRELDAEVRALRKRIDEQNQNTRHESGSEDE